MRGPHNVRNFHRRHGNAAELVNAAAAGALQKPARFVQKGVQARAQHAVDRIVVVVFGVSVRHRPAKMRLHVHVGFRVKFAHNFAREAVVQPVFHVSRHPPALADFAVQSHNLGLRQRRNAAPVFGNAGCIQAIHLFPLPLRVVFDERRLLRAVQHFEQAVQRHHESGHRPHDEVHRFDAALGVPQLGRVLPFIVHPVQHVNRVVVLNKRRVNVLARFIQQFLPAFGQLLA